MQLRVGAAEQGPGFKRAHKVEEVGRSEDDALRCKYVMAGHEAGHQTPCCREILHAERFFFPRRLRHVPSAAGMTQSKNEKSQAAFWALTKATGISRLIREGPSGWVYASVPDVGVFEKGPNASFVVGDIQT